MRTCPNERNYLLCGEPSEPGGDIIDITAVLGCSKARHAAQREGGAASRYETDHESDQCCEPKAADQTDDQRGGRPRQRYRAQKQV